MKNNEIIMALLALGMICITILGIVYILFN